MNAPTTLKTILVFQNGELIRQIAYKTKSLARRQFVFFKKHGIINPNTGELVKNTTFELI